MKHAILIMAHKNPHQLARLVKCVATPNMDVFIHLDSKMNFSDNDINIIKNNYLNVYYTKQRISGELDKWSLPQIVLNLINTVHEIEKEKGIEYKYFILLSGQDYPIRNIDKIYQYLCKVYPKPLIDCNPYKENTWLSSKFLEVRFLHMVEKLHNTFKPGIIRKLLVAPVVIIEVLTKFFRGTPYSRLAKLGCKIYGGSAWWILPQQVINYTCEQTELGTKVVKELKRTWTPEETFFQIMTMASTVSNLVDIIPNNTKPQNCMTFANFTTPKKAFCGHPHILLEEDYDRLVGYSKDYLFARKFDEKTDSKILDMIDDYIMRN